MEYLGISPYRIFKKWVKTQLIIAHYYFKYMLPNREAINTTRRLKGTCKGRKAFVFANGPSLDILDPSKILIYQKDADFDVFAVNSYINSAFSEIVKPNYYVLSDPVYFGHNTTKHTPEVMQEALTAVDKVKKIGATVFVPTKYYQTFFYKKKYAFCDAESVFSDNVSDITKPRGFQSMTAYKALSIACFLGYDEIYIAGFDNNYFKTLEVDKNNLIYYCNSHFYAPTAKNLLPAIGWGSDIGEILYDLHFLFRDLKKFSDKHIINLDENSLVDCFSKSHILDVKLY